MPNPQNETWNYPKNWTPPQTTYVSTRPVLAPAATDPTTTQTLVNSIRAALITLGLCQ